MKAKFLIFSILVLVLTSCGTSQSVVEVTRFTLNSEADYEKFNQLDTEIESNFTSKQSGFIKRQSGMDENGQYLVVVYWNSINDAAASMNKFMNDSSVKEYASMINGSSMTMNRYTINEKMASLGTEFIEVMSFKTKAETNISEFNKINKEVETGFTAKQKGFLQRITGEDEDGKQVVLVYWDSKGNSDKALEPFMDNEISKHFMSFMNSASIEMGRFETLSSIKELPLTKKEKVIALLNSFNTGDQSPISYINPNNYTQHNLAVGDGLEGFGEVMKHAPPNGFKANVVRAFQDGEYVFTHTEYDFFGPKAGFDVFRFEDGKIVEHWDNLIAVQPPNPSGRTQFDGATELSDLEKTEANKTVVKAFIEKVLLNHEMDKVATYINPEKYLQHNPAVADGLEGFGAAMKYFAENNLVMQYDKLHKVLGQGNFVLTMSEGKFAKGEHSAFYDLFRLENGQIVEHWDVIETIPAKEDWKNTNGKF